MQNRKKSLTGYNILITAGPTREYLDAVRFISNPSSGKMGFAIAEEASRCGAKVTLIAGPVTLSTPQGVKRFDVVSAEEMFLITKKHFPQCNIFISTAAVGDYAPLKIAKKKIKKSDANLKIELKPTVDILGTLARKKKNNQIIVGFAAETDRVLQNAKGKLKKKNLDMIVANDVSKKGNGFEVDTNQVWIISEQGKPKESKQLTKNKVAQFILNEIESLLSL